MADLELPHGPWKRIISATWGNYPLQIYENPERVLLVTLFEKKDDEIAGVLVLERRVLLVEGDASKFSLVQKREMTLIEKISKENRFKYLIVDSTPSFISYSEAEIANEVAKQYDELDAMTKIVKKGLESSSEAKAKDLRNANEDEVQNLLGDPISILSFSKRGVMIREMHEDRSGSGTRVLLGIDREGQKVEASLKSMLSSLVLGESKEKRLHMMHILVENALLNSVPCIIFDSEGAFSGLALPNKGKEEFEKFGMRPTPISFPFKQFELGKGLFVDLSLIDADQFLSAFNLEKADIAPLLKKVYDDKREKLSVLGDIIIELTNFKETKEFPKFSILRAIRMIEVLQKSNPMLFGKNISEELASPWKDGMGKVLYISLAKQRDEIKRLVVNSLMKGISYNPLSQMSLMMVFEPEPAVLKEDVVKQLQEFPKQGKAFIIQSEHESDTASLPEPSLKLELIGNEVILSEKSEPKRRFATRPAYSLCEEFASTPDKK